MTPLGNLTTAWRRVPALALALTIALAGASPASAGDATAEHEQLAALARQLNLIDRLAEHAANSAPQERARYHFDYARLRADLKRVRAGLQDSRNRGTVHLFHPRFVVEAPKQVNCPRIPK